VEEVRPLCIARRSVEADASGAVYDRREALDCLPYTFSKGQLFTQVKEDTATARDTACRAWNL